MASYIVAFGGGGFSEETDNTLLDDYIIELSRIVMPPYMLSSNCKWRRSSLHREVSQQLPAGASSGNPFERFCAL